LENPRFLEARYHIKDVAYHWLVAEKTEKKQSLHNFYFRFLKSARWFVHLQERALAS
jgi:hypothetical protein